MTTTTMNNTVPDNSQAGALSALKPLGPLGALSPRVGPLQGLRQTFSLAWRTLVQIKHNPTELIDFSIQPVMSFSCSPTCSAALSGARRTRT